MDIQSGQGVTMSARFRQNYRARRISMPTVGQGGSGVGSGVGGRPWDANCGPFGWTAAFVSSATLTRRRYIRIAGDATFAHRFRRPSARCWLSCAHLVQGASCEGSFRRSIGLAGSICSPAAAAQASTPVAPEPKKAELLASRTSPLPSAGQVGAPAVRSAASAGKTVAERKAETLEAARKGQLVPAGHGSPGSSP
jgi:hypothetical protein